nr:serine protease, subtilase family domain protein [Burkholderia pseudomallei]
MRPARIADIGRAHSTNDARDGRASRHRRRGSLHGPAPFRPPHETRDRSRAPLRRGCVKEIVLSAVFVRRVVRNRNDTRPDATPCGSRNVCGASNAVFSRAI